MVFPTKRVTARKLAQMAILLAVSLVLNYLESLFPFFVLLPGCKLGIANVVTLLAYSHFGAGFALLLGLLRSFLGAVFAGNLSAILYSGAGTVLSLAAMQTSRHLFADRVSMIGRSMLGAAFFNVGQVAVCALVLSNAYVFLYLPLLLFIAPFCGLFTGMIAQRIGGSVSFETIQNGSMSWKR